MRLEGGLERCFVPVADTHFQIQSLVSLAVPRTSIFGTNLAHATVPYAVKRVSDHINRFNYLADAAQKGEIHEPSLEEFEAKDNLFPDVDYTTYAR